MSDVMLPAETPVQEYENYENVSPPIDLLKKDFLDIGGVALGNSDLIVDRLDTEFSLGNYENSFKGMNKFSDFQKTVSTILSDDDSPAAYELRMMPIETLLSVLLKAGVISEKLFNSGRLQTKFSPDRLVTEKGKQHLVGGLRHILLGDVKGGLHDLDTLLDAGLAGEGTDTGIIAPTEKGTRLRQARGVTVDQGPDLRYATGVDHDGDGNPDEALLFRKHSASQFPEEWTTDEVLDAVMRVSETPPEEVRDNGTKKYRAVVNGVQIVVFTDSNGLIETGYPEYANGNSLAETNSDRELVSV